MPFQTFVRRSIRPHALLLVVADWRAGRRLRQRVRRAGDHLKRRWTVARLRREYGPTFQPAVADRDEMALFFQSVMNRSRAAAEAEYLQSGEKMLADLNRLLDRLGRPLSGVGSFLEFACGYGRFTRFVSARLGPARVTAADIDRSAVDFVATTFGVKTFYSAADPTDLTVTDRYDVIFVASLFSHLALPYWTAWAAKLMDLLADGGLLVFSVHGPHALDAADKATRQTLDTPAPGFTYGLMNETSGRLDGAYYGAAFVTEAFVRQAFDEDNRGRVIDVLPRGLWDYQDVYTVEKRTLSHA